MKVLWFPKYSSTSLAICNTNVHLILFTLRMYTLNKKSLFKYVFEKQIPVKRNLIKKEKRKTLTTILRKHHCPHWLILFTNYSYFAFHYILSKVYCFSNSLLFQLFSGGKTRESTKVNLNLSDLRINKGSIIGVPFQPPPKQFRLLLFFIQRSRVMYLDGCQALTSKYITLARVSRLVAVQKMISTDVDPFSYRHLNKL